ncbi:hypothetical protein [Arenimonas oryziterrae]|uniref:TonB C-terminal domain-containing protein n=1 Tax=Arenimonas oryziterrae DSM 21050 = YC6267 TaxID=1121015 RepID=A0A091AWI1_9GAMM|nr:hypothetical protein [Arenimonas oryziterrae]KFN43642.1 hypothetical protein N789_10220 [Arenimonas oryziterrae DSM 21050 = YC6267]
MGKRLLGCCCLLVTAFAVSATRAQDRESTLLFRVEIDAAGAIVRASPLSDIPEAVQRAVLAAAKPLHFDPAKVAGKPVPSATTLSLTVVFERQPEGGFRLRLTQASNGLKAALIAEPKYPSEELRQQNDALVVVRLQVREDGSTDAKAPGYERVYLSQTSSRAEQRFKHAIETVLADTRFDLDYVDGKPVASAIRIPFRFCAKPSGECRYPEDPAHPDEGLKTTSLVEGVELPSLRPLPRSDTP